MAAAAEKGDKLAPINTLRELAAFDRRHLVKNNNSAIIHFHPPAIRSIRFAVSLFRIRSRTGTKPRLNQGTLVSYMIPMSKRMGREIKMQWGGEFLRWQDTCTCREFIGRHSACNQEQPRLQPMPRRADQVGSLAAGASSSKSLNSIIEREGESWAESVHCTSKHLSASTQQIDDDAMAAAVCCNSRKYVSRPQTSRAKTPRNICFQKARDDI